MYIDMSTKKDRRIVIPQFLIYVNITLYQQ